MMIVAVPCTLTTGACHRVIETPANACPVDWLLPDFHVCRYEYTDN